MPSGELISTDFCLFHLDANSKAVFLRNRLGYADNRRGIRSFLAIRGGQVVKHGTWVSDTDSTSDPGAARRLDMTRTNTDEPERSTGCPLCGSAIEAVHMIPPGVMTRDLVEKLNGEMDSLVCADCYEDVTNEEL